MSSLGRHTDWVGTLIRYNSKIRYKPIKIAKIRYIRYKSKNPLYLKSLKSIFNRLGVFRSVRDLEVHKRMGGSDATCCASMAVNTCFFKFWCATPKIRLPGAPKLGAELIFMS